jgi:hypothetical protein
LPHLKVMTVTICCLAAAAQATANRRDARGEQGNQSVLALKNQ